MPVGQLFGLIFVGFTVRPCMHVTIDYSLSERFSNQMLNTKAYGKLRKRF